jgi:hypothetical protein
MPTTQTDLYRALKSDDFKGAFHVDGVAVDGLLYPRFQATTYTDGRGIEQTSQADVQFQDNPRTGKSEVQPGGGTSLFDVEGWFGYAHWRYFGIPNGTEFSEALQLKRSKRRRENRAKMTGYHCQIEPKNPMTADALKGALDTFARNAVVRSIELSKTGQMTEQS